MTDELTLKPGAFDLEAFVSGAVVAKDTVEVSSKAGLVAQMMQLMTEHADKSQTKESRGKRLAEKDGADVSALEKQIREIADDLEGSWVEVEITSPTPSQRREAAEAGKDVEEQTVAALLERVGRLRPKGTEEWAVLEQAGWLSIFDAIGNNQYHKINEKLAVLTYGKGVTPGFSQRALSYLETQGSSKS